MAEQTAISWTHHTYNIAWGCVKISPGCDRCYAERDSGRYGFSVWGKDAARRVFGAAHWREPLKWNRQAESEGCIHLVFSSSMCDICEDHPTITQERAKLWPLIRETRFLHWQLLTKRSQRIKHCLPSDWGAGYENVWWGTSIENPDYYWRIDELRKIPARIRFLSIEPMLAPCPNLNLEGIHWVICGGESGPGYRPMPHEWARDLLAQCRAADVPFFFKQSAAPRTEMGTKLDGREHKEYPIDIFSAQLVGSHAESAHG